MGSELTSAFLSGSACSASPRAASICCDDLLTPLLLTSLCDSLSFSADLDRRLSLDLDLTLSLDFDRLLSLDFDRLPSLDLERFLSLVFDPFSLGTTSSPSSSLPLTLGVLLRLRQP